MGIIKLITDHWEIIAAFCSGSFFAGKWIVFRLLKIRKTALAWIEKVDSALYELRPNGSGSMKDKVDRLILLMETAGTGIKFLTGRQDSLLDNLPYAFYQNDKDGICTFVNKAWVATTGLPRENAIGRGWVEIIHPDDLAYLEKRGQDFTKYGAKDFDGKFRMIHYVTKKEFNVHCTASKIFDKDTGEVLGIIGNLEVI